MVEARLQNLLQLTGDTEDMKKCEQLKNDKH